jgi:hypothetical protein
MADRGFGSGPGTSTGARAGTTLREEETHVRSSRPVAMRRVTSSNDREITRDRVRWGPVWAGLVVTVATYILLQLALLGSGAIDANFADGLNEGAVLSGLVGLLAFFVGGLVTGATAQWRHVTDGALNAIVTWSLAIVALITLSIIGGGFAAGAVGDWTEQFNIDTTAVEDVEFDTQQATETAREASANALLGLSAALAAIVLGGIAGAKMWPGKRDDDKIDLRDEATTSEYTRER